MANPLDPTFSPLTTRIAEPPLPTVGDYAAVIRQAGLAPRQGFVEEPEMPSVRTARLAYSPSQKKFFVGGYTFDDDNDTAAVTMSKYANQEAPLPEGDWQEVDPASYAQYVERIRDPGFFQQIANNFDIGLDEMQQTLGYGLMFAGAEDTGRWLADQESDLAKTQIYQRNVENIGENGVLDWIAATIGRLGPNIVESVITAGAGAAIGSAATPAGTAGGAVLGFFGKTAVKKALYEAAKKQFKGQALDAAEKKLLLSAAGMVNTASNAAKTKLAPGAFNQLMQEGLQTGAEAVAKRVAARAPTEIGAVGLSTASNIFQQTGQAYGETMAGGGPGDRAVALGVGAIGGLADTAGEFLLAGRVFSEAVGDVAGSVTKRQKALNLIKRVGAGAGVGAGMEGTTEAFQEALQLAANPVVNIGTPEGQSRLLNALAGGALLGGGFGGAGGIFAGSLADNKQEANLLLPVSKDDPNYAQYREDVKRQLGEAEYNKVFGPPQPYTRLMEEEASTQAMIAGIGGARQFAGTQAPLSGAPETFQVGPTPAIPDTIPGPAFGTSGEATATLPQGMQATLSPTAPAPYVPRSQRPAPVAPTPPVAPQMQQPTVNMGQMTGDPALQQLQQLQQLAMQQLQQAQQAAPAPEPTPLTRMPGGSALQQTATGELPGAQPPGSMMLRRGPGSALAQTAEMQGPAAPMPGSPTVAMNRLLRGGMSGQAAATMVPPLRPTSMVGRAGDISLRRSGQATGRMVPPAAPEKVATSAPSPAGGRIDALAFLTNLVENNRTSFTKDDLRRALFPKTSLVRRTKQYTMTDTVIDGLIRDKLVAEGPIGTYTVDTEKVRAPKPGTGTGSAAPAGKRGGKDRGAGKSGPLRKGAAATGQETASEAEGTAAGSDKVQAEAAVQPAVEVKVGKKQADGTRLVTLPDGRTATIYYDGGSKVWRIERPKGYPSKVQGQAGYVFDTLGANLEEAKQNVVETLDRMEAAVAEAKAANDQKLKQGAATKKLTDLQQFLNTAADPSSEGGMRGNPDLRDVVEYLDWLKSLSKAELAKIEPIFSKRYSPFHSAGSMNVAEVRAKLEEALSPKAPEVAATSAKTAADVATETDRNVWDDTFDDGGVGFDSMSTNGKAEWRKLVLSESILQDDADALRAKYDKVFRDKEKARKAAETAAEKARKAAEDEARRSASGDYDSMSEALQNELANDGKAKGTLIANNSPDAPKKPTPSDDKYSKAAQDIYEVYEAISNIITARRVRARVVDLDAKDTAKLNFINSTKFLYGWITDNEVHPQAQNIARAYLEKYVSTTEDLKGVDQAVKSARQTGMFKLSDFDAVANPIDENGRPAKGVNPIRVKAIVDSFKRGLAKAPTFHVYKNQVDLQRRNPTLYQQAVGSRPQGDFDTAPASGFAFDGKVIVFTDRIPTEKYMRLLLAHEAIGHFGMRALLPASKFDALMDYVYENNMAVRRAADSKLAGSTDLGARREAVEEYMAKYAEKLDSSVLTRVWNAIKDVLNKLGIKFEDDIVRYLVSQARRTVREGSSMFTPSTFALNVHTITTNNGTGRFSQEPLNTAQHELSNAFHLAAPPPYNLDTARQTLKDYKIDGADTLERFMRNVFRLRNFNALRNHGAKRFEDLKDAMRVAAQTLRNVYNEKLSGLLALTGESRHVVSYALVVSRRIADRRFMLDKELRNSGLIVLGDEQPDETRALDINKPIFERLLKMGTLSRDELNNGAEVTFEEPTEGGKYKKTTEKIPGVKDKLGRDITQNEYNIYVKTRRDLAELDVERLKGQLQNFIATEEITTKGIRKVLADKNMTDADVSFVKSVVNHAKKLHLDDIEYDERGMPIATPKDAVRMEKYFAAINTAVVKKEFTDDLKAEVRKFYLPKQGRDEDGNIKEPSAEALAEGNKKSEAAIKKIEEFRSRRTEFTGREEQSVVYTLQDRIKEIVLADAAFEKAQMSARRSIGSSHVPLWREGSWQVRVEAQINGKAVKLHPEVQNKLLFSLHTQRSESENAAAVFNGEMKGLEYSGLVYNEENGEYKTQTFKLFAVPSKVVESVASEPSIDIDNFLYTLRVLGQPLAPDKHAKAITMLTAPGSALRKALRFDDTAGYDPLKSVEAIARHVTTRSSLIARTKFQPHMRDLMDLSTDTGKLWFGDAEAVMTAKDNLDKATTDAAKAYWQDKLTTDLYKYVTTNPGAKGWDGSRASFPSQPKQASLGMRDYSDSVKEMEWMQDSSNINESTFEGKRLASGMKMITSIAFLGGMFTQFAQNLMSPATNVIPYLASKDSQTGFGGGFGMAVMPTYLRAFKDVVGFRGLIPTDPIKDAEAFDKIASDIKAARDTKNTAKEAELVQQYGLSYYEALNIAREIREGKLIPAQANALLETARGLWTGPLAKGFLKFSDFYMSPFNVSEQATRRATFLTAFRLEFDRLVKAGFNEDKASEMARMFAVDTVDKTLGEYSNTNRPPVWRDGWQSLLFVYKTYPLTSLLLFKNLSRAGKIGMLTSLYVLAGAAGFPLVDDMEDLIDTLSQRLGLDLGQGPSVRMAIIQQLEEVFPGWSDVILRGPLNHYTGADVGAKFGLEDFIPGTGILLKGANTTEELKSIAGPVVGMSLSMGKFFYDAARAPLSSTVSFTDVARESPFSLMRAGGDVAAYLQNGAIVDRRGYIVSPEVSAMTMAYRLMGFYPAEAAKQYDFIKYANRMNYDYKEVGMAYKLAWVKAKMTGDERQAARIVREVNDWNEANRGGPGMIRNFLKNAQRALKEARRPAGERFLKSAPVASRASYDRFMEYITGE